MKTVTSCEARQSLHDVYQQIDLAKLSAPQITFTGLSHFNNKVLYIDPVKDAQLDVLTRIAEICRETYEKNGIISTDVRPFNPHLTLFKLSKARDLHRKGIKKIDQCWSLKYTDHHFGIENIRSLHLCNMLKKQTDGYYEIFHEQYLFNNETESVLTDEMRISVELDNVISAPSIQRIYDDQVDNVESILCIPSMINESSPLIPRHQETHEEAFSGFNSVFQRCSCCSIT